MAFVSKEIGQCFFNLAKSVHSKNLKSVFCPKKINFDFKGLYLWTKDGFNDTLEYYVIERSVFGFYIPKYLRFLNFNLGLLKIALIIFDL